MGRLAWEGLIELGGAVLAAVCLAGAGSGCVGEPPVFTEPDAATPDADDDDPTAEAGPGPLDGPSSDGAADATRWPSDGAHDRAERDTGGGLPCDPSAAFIAVEPISELNAASDEEGARLSPDELVMYFTRRAGAGQPYQIYTATRASRDAPFGTAMPILLLANASGAMIAPDQLTLYYSSDRGGADPNAHLYMAKVPFSAATSIAMTALNSMALDYSPYVSADDSELYFVSRRPADVDDNIFAARREGDTFVEPAEVSPVNSGLSERSPVVSADGLRLYVGSNRDQSDDFGIYVASRAERAKPFEAPVAVSELNTASFEMPDWISPDHCTIYFRSDRPEGRGGRDLWRARRR